MSLSCEILQWLPSTLIMKSKCVTMAHKSPFPILSLVTSPFSYMGLCTCCSVTWNGVEPSLLWWLLIPLKTQWRHHSFQEAFPSFPSMNVIQLCPWLPSHHMLLYYLLVWGAHLFIAQSSIQLFREWLKAMSGIHLSLLSSAHLHRNGFQFLQNKRIIPSPLPVPRVYDSIAPKAC